MKISVIFSVQWTVSEGGEVNTAIDYSIRAGEAACAVFGYQEAVAHWRAALELMPKHLEDPEPTSHRRGLRAGPPVRYSLSNGHTKLTSHERRRMTGAPPHVASQAAFSQRLGVC